LSEEEQQQCEKIIIGELMDKEKPEFTAEWAKLVESLYVA